jgi:hypothetical protein
MAKAFLKFLLLIVLIILVSSKIEEREEDKKLQFLGDSCAHAGERCASQACCDKLTCSEFKICRS